MNITDVRLIPAGRDDRLRAFATVVVDDSLAVRDVKIVEGRDGVPFLAMPCRKTADRCPACGGKNCLSARWCNWCGGRLDPFRAAGQPLYADVVHPVSREARAVLEAAVFGAWRASVDSVIHSSGGIVG